MLLLNQEQMQIALQWHFWCINWLIWETLLQVEFTAMRDQYMRCGEGFMICYSVTDRHSFQEVSEYRKLISRVRANEDIPLVLVGNKFDLQYKRKVIYFYKKKKWLNFTPTKYLFILNCINTFFINETKVTMEEGRVLADQMGCPFYETSAALRQFIDDAFYSLVRQIRAKERSRNVVRKRSRWRRLRSIFAFIFRKRRHNQHNYSPWNENLILRYGERYYQKR